MRGRKEKRKSRNDEKKAEREGRKGGGTEKLNRKLYRYNGRQIPVSGKAR